MSKSAAVFCLLVDACSAAPSERHRRLRPVLDGSIVGGEPVDISQFPLAGLAAGLRISSMRRLHHQLHVGPDGSALPRPFKRKHAVRASWYLNSRKRRIRNHWPATQDYDFAVLELSGSISFENNVQAVSLGNSELAAGTAVTITGWGNLSYGGNSTEQLRAVTTHIVERSECNAAYGVRITRRMICAGEKEGGKGSCQGDSGGPLVVATTQHGVVSWGTGCAYPGYPGVYCNVPAVSCWITETTGV
ncbi:trypsin-3-like [Schistocerca cancellata]|uniref:trypsin-3-like n=1 Tax=Schistocerca cancellata TaxID=274614 RepID=UPI002118EA97|nr:trypsin-3-like [Schistocerca cancellata]